MFKKIVCFLWGHKTVHKAYTGEKMAVVGVMGNRYDISLYRYEKTDFCIRCGKPPNKGGDE